MSVVEVDRVEKHYGSVAALAGVSLTFADGEFFGLLGPSGSGKTTLLRAIAGFVEPDSGEIRLDGTDIGRTPVHRREIGMVFQNYALFPHMSVFDNVAFGLSVRGQKGSEADKRVKEMLALVRLAGFDARRPRQLSGGQQQREVGITTVFVTHDQEEALTLSDRVAIFNEGRVVQAGKPLEIYERPMTAFAANFLGDANFFEGKVEAPGRIATALGALTTSDALPASGSTAMIAVRPEKIALTNLSSAGNNGNNRLEGRLTQAVYSGMSTTYKIDVNGREITVFEQNKGAPSLTPGIAVRLEWAPAHSVVVQP